MKRKVLKLKKKEANEKMERNRQRKWAKDKSK